MGNIFRIHLSDWCNQYHTSHGSCEPIFSFRRYGTPETTYTCEPKPHVPNDTMVTPSTATDEVGTEGTVRSDGFSLVLTAI